MKVRVKFRKFGPVRFIGHLDLMRFFQKAIRRADLDVAYTGGFSPHQIMSFAAPLGVGLTSDGEYMDIELHSMVSCQDVMDRLNQVSVPGIQIVSVKVLPEKAGKAGNAMASVAAAAYQVAFREGRGPKFSLEKGIGEFLSREQVLITKDGKAGPRQVDIRPGIYECRCEGDTVYMLLDASSGGNIKPVQVLQALFAMHQQELLENALLVNRLETYTNLGTAEEPRLVSMDEIGSEEWISPEEEVPAAVKEDTPV